MEWMSNLSGDEHVTVFNRITGKKLSGTQGPKLKCLAQWLIENPMFEVSQRLHHSLSLSITQLKMCRMRPTSAIHNDNDNEPLF